MQKILITGGAGFVGRHFCEYFLRQGDEVHCVDSVVPSPAGSIPRQAGPSSNRAPLTRFISIEKIAATISGASATRISTMPSISRPWSADGR